MSDDAKKAEPKVEQITVTSSKVCFVNARRIYPGQQFGIPSDKFDEGHMTKVKAPAPAPADDGDKKPGGKGKGDAKTLKELGELGQAPAA